MAFWPCECASRPTAYRPKGGHRYPGGNAVSKPRATPLRSGVPVGPWRGDPDLFAVSVSAAAAEIHGRYAPEPTASRFRAGLRGGHQGKACGEEGNGRGDFLRHDQGPVLGFTCPASGTGRGKNARGWRCKCKIPLCGPRSARASSPWPCRSSGLFLCVRSCCDQAPVRLHPGSSSGFALPCERPCAGRAGTGPDLHAHSRRTPLALLPARP